MYIAVAFELSVLLVSVLMIVFLTYKGYTDQDAWLAWIGATLGVVSNVLFFFGYIGEHGIAPDVAGNARQVATFVIVVATLVAATSGIVWWLRKRPQTAQTAQTASHTNYVSSGASYAYGSYTPADIKAARAKATQARKQVRA